MKPNLRVQQREAQTICHCLCLPQGPSGTPVLHLACWRLKSLSPFFSFQFPNFSVPLPGCELLFSMQRSSHGGQLPRAWHREGAPSCRMMPEDHPARNHTPLGISHSVPRVCPLGLFSCHRLYPGKTRDDFLRNSSVNSAPPPPAPLPETVRLKTTPIRD